MPVKLSTANHLKSSAFSSPIKLFSKSSNYGMYSIHKLGIFSRNRNLRGLVFVCICSDYESLVFVFDIFFYICDKILVLGKPVAKKS